jgi:hypothetical protein
MLKIAHARPSVPEYPQIAEHIHQALNDVYYGLRAQASIGHCCSKICEGFGMVKTILLYMYQGQSNTKYFNASLF